MDKLDQAIVAKRREVEKLKMQHHTASLELKALERAAALRPGATPVTDRVEDRPQNAVTAAKARPRTRERIRKGGRKVGSISKDWREVLHMIFVMENKRQTYPDIHSIAQMMGLNVSEASTRDRVRNMVKTGLLSGTPERGFAVTDEAIAKFGFAQSNEAPAGKSGSASEAGEAATSPNESRPNA
ncbi:MAG: hypothetical protein Q7V31_11910 [Parvibaculum sp.]|uniref:hypothetical protein n=1 Tax=Parvibaculum sp. TaxID=2024848 RepID=UPI0027191987|nr:hypothetical protein [Parvibaculum sp.]MDO8839624.1 hypothetical protein [Parvibaculum sp.]